MNDKGDFHNVITNIDRYQTSIISYLIQEPEKVDIEGQFLAFQESILPIKEPRYALWEFMDQENLKMLLLMKKKSHIRNCITQTINKEHPKGQARLSFVELMFNVTKYCKTSNFSLEKTGALLSQFYLTHLFFTNKLDMSAEKVYNYFKELTLCNSLPFPPSSLKIFSHKETQDIMELFCKLYLRNLPLIRFLCLPNFAFYLNYELEPDIVTKKPKAEKLPKVVKKVSKKGSKK